MYFSVYFTRFCVTKQKKTLIIVNVFRAVDKRGNKEYAEISG